MYKNEKEFLDNYDSSQFEKLSVTTDILIFSISDEETSNYRKTTKKHMSVLLVKRNDYPYKDKWCLPGGFLKIDENLDECPARILEKETNLKNIYLEQLYTFGEAKRDPRMRIISSSYMALVDKRQYNESLSENASWFNVSYEEDKDRAIIMLDNNEEQINLKITKKLYEKTTDRYQFIDNDNILAFDHSIIILSGLNRLKNKLEYTDIVFNMMPKYFTLGELQQVYEVILNKTLLAPAFRRIIADKVEKTEKMRTGGGHRPSSLFKYRTKE